MSLIFKNCLIQQEDKTILNFKQNSFPLQKSKFNLTESICTYSYKISFHFKVKYLRSIFFIFAFSDCKKEGN